MNDFELKLKRLSPNAVSFDRDALLYAAVFAAGRAAGRKPWMRLSAVLALAIVAVSFAWVFTNRLPQLPPQLLTPAEAPATVVPPKPEPYQPEPTSYIALMQNIGEYAPPANLGSAVEPRPPLTPRSRFD